MFDNIPDDVPELYLGGAAVFVLSGGERSDDMSQQDYAYVLNELTGYARVAVGDEDKRASQQVVPREEAGDDVLAPDEYTANVFGEEVKNWAQWAMDQSDEIDTDE